MRYLLLIYPTDIAFKPAEFVLKKYSLLKLKTAKNSYGYSCDYFEFSTTRDLLNIKNIREEMIPFEVDVLVLPHLLNFAKKSMFVFDMDSTLIKQEVIDEVARKYGMYEQVSSVTREAMEGKLDFNQSLKRRCSLLRDAPVSIFESLYSELELNSGVRELLSQLNQLNVITCVFSGGFDLILNRFGKEMNFNYFASNHLEVIDEKITGNIVGDIVNKEKKEQLLVSIREKEEIISAQSVAIGDGANDMLMLNVAGIGIGYHAKAGLKQGIKNWIDFAPMSSLLFLYDDYKG